MTDEVKQLIAPVPPSDTAPFEAVKTTRDTWQDAYNALVVKTAKERDELTAKLAETTAALKKAEGDLTEYRKVMGEQSRIIDGYRKDLTGLLAYKATVAEYEKTFKDNLERTKRLVSEVQGGVFVCEECGRKFPVNADMVMHHPYDCQGGYDLVVLCEDCAEQAVKDV